MATDTRGDSEWRVHDGDGFFGLIGPVLERWNHGELVLGFEAGDRHTNQSAVVQGGMLMTMVDRVMGHALRVALDGQPVATVQLDTHFVATGKVGNFIEAHAEITRITRSVAFIQGRITVGNHLLMTASGIWKRLRDDDGHIARKFKARFLACA